MHINANDLIDAIIIHIKLDKEEEGNINLNWPCIQNQISCASPCPAWQWAITNTKNISALSSLQIILCIIIQYSGQLQAAASLDFKNPGPQHHLLEVSSNAACITIRYKSEYPGIGLEIDQVIIADYHGGERNEEVVAHAPYICANTVPRSALSVHASALAVIYW